MIYEINFMVLQSKTAELEKIKKDTKAFIESFGAKITEEKEYLKRKLAYEIQHENYGFFTVFRFEFKNAKNLDELKNKLNQRTEVARYIIIKADGLPSLDEQDAKELEKIHNEKKSIKSEDVEKILTEQKKAEKAVKTEVKKTTAPKKEETVTEDKKDPKEEKGTPEKKPVAEKTEKVAQEKTEVKKDGKKKDSEVSLDELDKKLDEILNS